jgi:4-alpha-glucanotransferase
VAEVDPARQIRLCLRVQFGALDRPAAGVAVPLFSLRTERSAGIGQFPDIIPLAQWCAYTGLRVIQLLPLNDTGDMSSPYSALSAFALNPVYVDLGAVEGGARVSAEVEEGAKEAEREPRVDYPRVRKWKLDYLRRIFEQIDAARRLAGELAAWADARPWARGYAAFAALKEEAHGAPWWEWPEEARSANVEGLFRRLGPRAAFHLWVQREAERQLEASAVAAGRLGVRIKGDLPIFMSRDSADVWSSPEYFDTSHQAGAPPDMFSPEGQNWGFPPYRWDILEREDYGFWRDRVAHAARFYHAVRIDHVLGFLRIWRIPAGERSGALGHYHPRRMVGREELHAAFDAGRIVWLSVSHTRGADIDAALGPRAAGAKERLFRKLRGEDLYHLKPELASEEAIRGLEEPEEVRGFLIRRHHDRALLEMPDGSFAPAWYYAQSSAYGTLTREERGRFEGIVRSCYDESERIWEATGRRLLGMLRSSTDMLLCAEDLGAVPDCLPRVLDSLGILSLKIERWARDYKADGQPYLSPASYPRLSVCAPSVHDTTPLRGWWEEPGWDREKYYRMIGGTGGCPPRMDPELCARILDRAMRSASLLTVAQIQDYLALTEDLRLPDPADERVNVPGTVGPTNWSYRIPVSIAAMARHDELNRRVRAAVAARGGASEVRP